VDGEDLETNKLVNQLVPVTLQDNTLVSMTLNHAVPVDIAQMNQDTSLDKTDQDVKESESNVIAFPDSTPTSGTV
jgi:hypothetical protein